MITILFGRAAQFLLALITIRVATTLLSPAEMGSVSLVLTTTAFFAMFLVNPVGMFINRRLHAWQESRLARYYLIRYVNYLLLVAIVAAIGLYFLDGLGVLDFGIPISWLIFLVCGSLIFNTVNQTAIPSLNLLGFSGSFVVLTVATIATSLVWAISLVQLIDFSAQYWLLGILIGQVILGIIGTKILFSRLPKLSIVHTLSKIDKVHLNVLSKFAWPVALAAGLAWVQGQGYRYLLEDQLGLAQLGLFAAGYGISAGMIAGFESVLATYFQPRLYRDVSRYDPVQQSKAWRRYAAAIIPSLVLTAAFIVMLAPELTLLLLGENFQSAVIYVAWGACAEAGRVLVGTYSLIAHVHMTTRRLILPNLVGAILAISLSVLLIPVFGTIGVGMALVISAFTVVLMMHVLLARQVNGGPPIQPILIAILAAIVLWGIMLMSRYVINASNWIGVLGVLMTVGLSYLGMQYLLLRKHFTEKVCV